MIFHIPHSSTYIPDEYQSLFYLNEEELERELLLMTDSHTEKLFSLAVTEEDSIIVFPVSRLLVDPERFPEDEQEEMSQVGMGAIYSKTHSGMPLKDAERNREELLDRYYKLHHEILTERVAQSLSATGQALIIDCHSFPQYPLAYEFNQSPLRPQICIGTDEFHTPQRLIRVLTEVFSAAGFNVGMNKPFAGSIVPLQHYQNTSEVSSVMIEIRRDTYMDEATGLISDKFEDVQQLIELAVSRCRVR